MADDNSITYFGETDYRNKRTRFGIKAKDRSRHVYVIGKTGMGKSTLLENMAIQDIQNGEGMGFIDPHGGTAEKLLDYVPESRINDVIYFAPFDTDFPISFNVLEDVDPDKRHLVVSGLMSTFKKIWVDAWSARMEYILQNTLLALLEYPNSTLLGVNKMLSDKDFRKKVVDNITDPSVKSFWVDEFAKYTERMAAEAVPAIQNKIGQFTGNALIRNMIGQPKSSFDMRKVMDEKKILIMNLSKGRVGEQNASLLGGMLITKIYLGAMSRADATASALKAMPHFYFYVDEFQSFSSDSFADILSEARKYKLSLTIAHQYVEQMSEMVRAAVFGNVGTMIVYRVGSVDAEIFEKEFAPQFTSEDIVNLGQYQMYLRLMIDGVGSKPFSARGMAPIVEPDNNFKVKIIEQSRNSFAKSRAVVEESINKWIEGEKSTPQTVTQKVFTEKPTQPSPQAQKEFVKPKIFEKPIQKNENMRPQNTEIKASQPSPKLQEILAKLEEGDAPEKKIEPEIQKVESPKPISLNSLKTNSPNSNISQTNIKDTKGPSEKNVSALKDILSKAMADTSNKVEMPKKEIPPEEKQTPVEMPKSTTPKEVPEEVLRKILE